MEFTRWEDEQMDEDHNGRRLRSRRWFDDPHDPAMTG
jgi:hypothetical protein